ncbi:unnamed protein product, partial [Ixodes persulcatus]
MVTTVLWLYVREGLVSREHVSNHGVQRELSLPAGSLRVVVVEGKGHDASKAPGLYPDNLQKRRKTKTLIELYSWRCVYLGADADEVVVADPGHVLESVQHLALVVEGSGRSAPQEIAHLEIIPRVRDRPLPRSIPYRGGVQAVVRRIGEGVGPAVRRNAHHYLLSWHSDLHPVLGRPGLQYTGPYRVECREDGTLDFALEERAVVSRERHVDLKHVVVVTHQIDEVHVPVKKRGVVGLHDDRFGRRDCDGEEQCRLLAYDRLVLKLDVAYLEQVNEVVSIELRWIRLTGKLPVNVEPVEAVLAQQENCGIQEP